MMDDILKLINAGEVSGNDIKAGTSMPRNMFLFNNAIYLLPYTGVGSGITRALDEDVNVTFMNNDKAQEFVITVWRGESNQVEKKSNQVEGKSNQVGNQVEEKSNQVQDSDTRLRHSGTDLDTRLRHSNTNLDTQLRHSDTKKVSLSNKQRDIANSVQFLEQPLRSWNALVYPIKPRTESVTLHPLLQQDICR